MATIVEANPADLLALKAGEFGTLIPLRQTYDTFIDVARTMADMQSVREEQRYGVTQVSRAVEQMNQGTQQTAAMVEQIAATADHLSQQAQALIHSVSAFKLAGTARSNDRRHGGGRAAAGGTAAARDRALMRETTPRPVADTRQDGKVPVLLTSRHAG